MRINLQAPINQLGYGVAGLNILKALQNKAEVSLFPIGQPQVTNQEDHNAVLRAIDIAKFYDPKAPCIKIWHQNQMAERIGSGKFIGFPIFELDTFNNLEKHHLQSCDELMVCSKWARKVVRDNCDAFRDGGFLLDQIHVVPLGVDSELFPPAPVRQDDKTIFFNCGKWEIRKGHDILMKAFEMVLGHGENAELWMMCSNPFNSEAENARWHQLYNHPKVRLIPRAETQAEVYNIMSQVDCGVFPSRGEGWNLELLEMMSAGKHVVATNYSAHTEFCTKENSGLVEVSDVEPAFDGKWFFNQGNWARLGDHEQHDLYMKMIKFILDKKGTVNTAGIETAKRFSWDNTANKILQTLKG
jgi:glycosyltransferase involved in cell wall biosynthesis